MSIYEWTKRWAEEKGMAHLAEPKMDSTQKIAIEEAHGDIPPEKIYFTDFQTHGQGRGDHVWISSEKPGSCLFSSWSYLYKDSPQHLASLKVGLALLRSVDQIWPQLNWSLKPPNDLFVNDKKVGGLLLHHTHGKRMIIGFGFNVFDHPSSIDCDHLAQFSEVTVDQWQFFLSVLSYNFYHILPCLDRTELNEIEIQKLNFAISKNIHYKNLDTLLKNGDLKLQDQSIISWKDL